MFLRRCCERRETLGNMIRDIQMQELPFFRILGDEDLEIGTRGVRSREQGDMGPMP